ncbi:unnamed protein product [Closterium sp. NIES-64]|nr:unnamed protein product [Closterium sp. NIES-64]
MRNAGLRPFPAWAHTPVALPAFPTDYGHIWPHYARVAASLHGHTAFSCVEYLSSAGRTMYGRLILLLDAKRPLDDSSYEPAEVAVLQRLSQQGLDECTGCEVLGPPSLYRGLAVVPIDRLKRAVHCIPSFEQKDVSPEACEQDWGRPGWEETVVRMVGSDGHSWLKYGQKQVQRSNATRSA